MRIQVFGMGCTPCKEMLRNVKTAVEELNLHFPVEHVTRVQEMLDAGITGTPALVVNGKVKCVGRVLDIATIESILVSAKSEVDR